MKTETRGRPLEASSLRSLGQTVIAIDKPTRENLKKLAAANGKTLAGFLRELGESRITKGEQTIMPGSKSFWPSHQDNTLIKIIDNLTDLLTVKMLDDWKFVGDTEKALDDWIKMLSFWGTTEYAQTRLEEGKAILRAKQEQAELERQKQQIPLLAPGNLKEGEATA